MIMKCDKQLPGVCFVFILFFCFIVMDNTFANEVTHMFEENKGGNVFDKLTFGVYWPWERLPRVAEKAGIDKWEFTARTFQLFKDEFSIDTFWPVNIELKDLERNIRIADEIGVNFLGHLAPFVSTRITGNLTTDKLSDIAVTSIEKLKNLSGLSGYVLIDEPQKHEYPIMSSMQKEIALLDPAHPSLIVTQPRNTEVMIRKTQFPISVVDVYPFFGPDSPNGPNTVRDSQKYYYTVAHQVAKLATEYNKKAWIMPQVFSDVWGPWYYAQDMNVVIEPGAYYHWRMPTIAEVKWQIWQGIAAGMKGIIFYVTFPTPNQRKPGEPFTGKTGYPDWPKVHEELKTGAGSGLLNIDGTPTPQLIAAGEEFSKLKVHEHLLGRLRLLDCPLVFVDNPFNVKCFEDPLDGRRYAVVVNNNTEEVVTSNLYVPGSEEITDLLMNRELIKSEYKGGLNQVELTLQPGEGAILELGFLKNVTCILRDEFEFSHVLIGDTENIELINEPYEFSNIRKYGIKAKNNTTGSLSYNVKKLFFREQAIEQTLKGNNLILVINSSEFFGLDRIDILKKDGASVKATLIQSQEVFDDYIHVYELAEPHLIENIILSLPSGTKIWDITMIVVK